MMPQEMRSIAGVRRAGREYSSQELAAVLNHQAPILKTGEGGVTFSGGEPLMQADFIAEVIDLLEDFNILLDTSGDGSERDFRLLLERVNLVYYDLKLIDSQAHTHYTGRDNDLILKNLQVMSTSGVPFVIRVPLVPGVTDTNENLAAIAETIKDMPGMLRVDLLPYNRTAGAKYQAAGMEFKPEYDETSPVNANVAIFEDAGIMVRVV
jgi:pyruvate formate lyase activating enzyme